MWLCVSYLGTHCLQISVQRPIIERLQLDSYAVCSPMDTSRQLKEDLEALPPGMSVLCAEIVVTCPHPYSGERKY